MKITRKLLTPIIIILLLILGATVIIIFQQGQIRNQELARKELGGFIHNFFDTLDTDGDLALALALEVANNPEVQVAFASQDRERLIELTLPSYEVLNREIGIPQHQFHLAPATSFLRLHQLDRYGDDLSSFRPMVVEANVRRTSVSGPEVGRGGLGVRGVTPVTYGGGHFGTVEFGINISDTLLNTLKEEYGVDWQIFITKEAASIAQFEGAISSTEGPLQDLVLQANTLEFFIDVPAEYYIQALGGEIVAVIPIETEGLFFAVMLAPIRDYSGNIIGVVAVYQDRTVEQNEQQRIFILNIIAATVIVALVYGLLYAIATRTLSPIGKLTKAATAVAAGELEAIPEIRTNDELGQLAKVFSIMTVRLRDLITGLEERVAERTEVLEIQAERLQAAADVGRAASTILETDRLTRNIVQIIEDRFNLYYVGLFLADDDFIWANLQAGTGEAGQAMLARAHKIKIGEGMIGWSIANGRPRVAEVASDDAVRLATPELPETRSEAAIPLRARGKIIGALTIQDNKLDSFTPEAVAVLQLVADQIGVALDNAQLYADTQAALESSRRAYGQLGEDAWAELLSQQTLGYREDARGTTLVTGQNQKSTLRGGLPELEIPIMIQNRVVGTILAHKKEESGEWDATETSVMQALSRQINIALESARLYEETQRRAAREQISSVISSRMRETLDMETILKTAVGEIQRALGLQEVGECQEVCVNGI